MVGLFLFGLSALSADPESAQELPEGPAVNVDLNASTNANLVFREIQPGILALGDVRLDKTNRTVSFPAAVNLHESLAEYLVVSTHGKIHESVLRTAAQPYQIHVAMLLLGVHGHHGQDFPANQTEPLPGTSLTIEVSWDGQTPDRPVPGQTLARHRQSRKTMPNTHWVYTGSMLFQGTFLAQQEGSIVALYTDPAALINYPGPDRDDDENWEPNPDALPPLESVVTVTLRLAGERRRD